MVRTHGKSQTFEHRVWKGMRVRCNNPRHHSFKNYGGRGIKVCPRWDDFATFLADVGAAPSERHSIERVNVNGDYEPSNCRWASKTEQMRNTRRNRILEIGGVRKTLREWCNETGIRYDAARQRLDSGVAPSNAINPNWKRPERAACANGHSFNEENTYMYKGMKKCRTCVREAGRRHYEKNRCERMRKELV